MATVFMKWLETTPGDYDRGIQLLTLGRLERLRQQIVRDYVRQGMRVLEIGCGTGTLAISMAQAGAVVTAIDASPPMLAQAQKKVAAADLHDRVTLIPMDATSIGDRFPPASFDLIVSALVFSELPPDEQRYVLEACAPLLAPGGRLLIADEAIPSRPFSRVLFYLVRWPLVLLTWLLTRTSTASLRSFDALLAEAGFRPHLVASYLGGSLTLLESRPAAAAPSEAELHPAVVGTLRHRVTLRTLLIDLWALFFRIIPPYPKVRPGLYAVGQPDRESPVLVTGNFDLTVRRLLRAIDGRVDAWLLVADSAGINVWCGAGGGYFTADKVIAAVASSHLDEVVDHHALILPQLCANGVDGWRVRHETGWGVHWGPVRAQDIPAYLAAGRKKTDAMRWVRFPLRDRLEMTTVTLGFYGLLILVPVLIFWRTLFWPIAASLVALSYFYAVVHPRLPGRDGLFKSVPLALIALAGLLLYSAIWNPLPIPRLFNWAVGLTGLSVFTGAELQGMSPLMRGEQANWGWEAIIAVTLGLIYWLVPLFLGWR
jgi:ubiquinone/menaquinone biosynthesis C-methylase UbiE